VFPAAKSARNVRCISIKSLGLTLQQMGRKLGSMHAESFSAYSGQVLRARKIHLDGWDSNSGAQNAAASSVCFSSDRSGRDTRDALMSENWRVSCGDFKSFVSMIYRSALALFVLAEINKINPSRNKSK
jgi:hypothetical protein